MTQYSTAARISPMLAGIDRLIELLEEQANVLSPSMPGVFIGQRRGQSRKRPSPQLEELELFITRLHQIKTLLQQNPQLLPIVDEYIGQQVRAMEKRQSVQNIRVAVITTVGGAVLGWLISVLGSPMTLWHLLVH